MMYELPANRTGGRNTILSLLKTNLPIIHMSYIVHINNIFGFKHSVLSLHLIGTVCFYYQ